MTSPERRYGAYVFDCDGTVYVGESAIVGAVEAISTIRSWGAQTLFMTNNPTWSQADVANRLTGLGIPTPAGDVVSSIDALIAYLRSRHPRARLLVVGEDLLQRLLQSAGFDVAGEADAASEADVVVVAFDRTFDYRKLKRAFDAVNAGARIVATNPDRYCPSPDGGLPDCAAMLAALEACTGARADAVVGKPSPHMADVVRERLGVPVGEAIFIGDRLETDVRMARELRMDSALVLTGATSEADLVASQDAPSYVLGSLLDLLPPDEAARRHSR